MRFSDLYLLLLGMTASFASVLMYVSGITPLASLLLLLGVGFAVISYRRTVRSPRLLTVGFPASRSALRYRLDEVGYRLRDCAGPSAGPCPVMQGEACPYSSKAFASAVIYLEAGSPDAPPCGSAVAAPELLIAEGSFEPASFGTGGGHIGANQAPD
ncbi:MAG TPA: hypothetical protein VI541_00085, partial [Actinomycetota bacterium]|nr:hypothetical protein [Actinomycetota bacterium]